LANILIVDDDPEVQAIIRIVLERAGHALSSQAMAAKGLRLRRNGLSEDGDQAGRDLQPAKAVQAGRAAGGSQPLP